MHDIYENPGLRLVSARTLDQLKESMLFRYDQSRKIVQSLPNHYDDQIKKNSEHFEKRNPGYKGNFPTTCNSLGLRQPYEILTEVDCCFYGCSITWGSGVPDSAVWPAQLASSMGWSYNNFAVPAIGQEECVNLFMATSRMIKMQTAIFMLPDFSRVTQAFMHEDQLEYFTITGILPSNSRKDIEQFHRDYNMLPDYFFYDKQMRNLEIISRLAELQGIRVLVSNWSGHSLPTTLNLTTVTVPCGSTDKNGRDRSHPGCQWHMDVAAQFQTAIDIL